VLGPLAGSFADTMIPAISNPSAISRRSTTMRPDSVAACELPDRRSAPLNKPAHSGGIADANLIGAHVERVVQRALPIGSGAADVSGGLRHFPRSHFQTSYAWHRN